MQRETEDLLDDIDLLLRKSLDLDEDATDEEVTKRADQAVREYVQKGGQ